MADDVLSKDGATAPELCTFSCFDPSEPDEEDMRYFSAVEKLRGRQGYHAELKSQGDTLALDSSSFLPTPGFGLREELKSIRAAVIASGGYRVLLSGVGGDEMLGQTLDPRILIGDLIRTFRVKRLIRELIAWSLQSRRPLIELFLGALLMELPKEVRRLYYYSSRSATWINPAFAHRHGIDTFSMQAVEGSWVWPARTRDALQTFNALRRQMSMALPEHAETRYPYLDQDLVEFLMSIPADQLLRPGETRSLMRRALSGLLPPQILRRRTKSGMSRCVILTLMKHWEEVDSALKDSVLGATGYADPVALLSKLRGIRDGVLTADFVRDLRALSAELWIKDAMRRGVIVIGPAFPGMSKAVISAA